VHAARRGQPARSGGPALAKVPVARRGAAVLLDHDDVYWAEANGDTTRVATYDELLPSSQSMRELEDLLPSARFFRIHRRYLVNVQRVARLELAESGRWVVHLTDGAGTTLEVARRQTRALKQHLGLR
jgi:DNA-binding LytR/AlgR family response regulator